MMLYLCMIYKRNPFSISKDNSQEHKLFVHENCKQIYGKVER